MIEPLRYSVEVTCSPAQAFATWTERAGTWWPRTHTASVQKGTKVIFETGVGGRIYERTPEGEEIDWGEITAWTPPESLSYSWFIRVDRADATDVTIRFVDLGNGSTRVDIEHAGWERLGGRGPDWRTANEGGWTGVLPHYVKAANATR